MKSLSFSFPVRFMIHLVYAVLFFPALVLANEHLTINSEPQGATVELDGSEVGKTPYSVEIPGGYLHGTKTAFGKLLRHQLHLKLTLEGYLPKELDLANGPTPWLDLNGRSHGDFWILKNGVFNIKLEKASTTFTGTIKATLSDSTTVAMGSTHSTEEIVRNANPAVLFLSSSEGTGSGFLVSETGVAVTNAHVGRGLHRWPSCPSWNRRVARRWPASWVNDCYCMATSVSLFAISIGPIPLNGI